MEKRKLHIDLQGTLLTRFGQASRNGYLIANFAKVAHDNGHVVHTVTWSYVDHDDQLEQVYPQEAQILKGTLDKGDLEKAAWATLDSEGDPAKNHDILIDDNPDIRPGEIGFEYFANIWIDPNSRTLIEDLQSLARNELGFEWQPPEV